MSNYCNFTVYMLGREEEIREVDKIFKAEYNYYLKPSFAESLCLYNDIAGFTKLCNLDVARKEAERSRDTEVLDKLENITKQDFVNIPDTKHLFRIFEYYPAEELYKVDEYDWNLIGDLDTYLSMSNGVCSWNVLSCMTDDHLSYYSEAKPIYPKNIFMGTHLQEISQMYPDLKICIVSEGLRFKNFETLCAVGGKVSYDCKEDGIDIIEDQITKDTYTKSLYEVLNGETYFNQDYIFDKLNKMKLSQ